MSVSGVIVAKAATFAALFLLMRVWAVIPGQEGDFTWFYDKCV